MSDWISYNELLDQGIKSFELLEHLREGLHPYSRPNKPIYCPYHYHRYEYLSRKHSRLSNLIEFLRRSDITEEIFLDDKKETKLILIRLDEYLRESIKRYNSEVTSEYRIQIYDHVFVDPHAQSESLSKFINCLKKKREETLKEIEDIVDDDPNLNEDQKKLSWKYLIIPDSEEKYNDIVLKLENAFFKKDDVDRFVKKKEKQSSPGIAIAIEATDHLITDKENVLKRIGKNWVIKYHGERTSLPDYNRIRYIVHLLDKPFVQINVVDLFEAVKKENISEKIEKHSGAMKSAKDEWEGLSEEKKDERGVSLTDLAIDGLTHEEKDRFEDQGYKILQKLKDAKANKNQPMIDQAEKEWEGYKNHMFNEYGIKTHKSTKGISFVQMHRPGPEVEKARKNVTNQIKNAIKDIEKEIPQLAQHLRKHVETGKDCVYRPDGINVIDWHITW